MSKKVFFLIKTINIAIDIFILKTRFYLKSIPEFDKKYKIFQIKVKKLKKKEKKKRHRRELKDI